YLYVLFSHNTVTTKIYTLSLHDALPILFEMLKRINKENGKGLIKASIEAAELVFIDSRPYKARCIRVWAKYWLQNSHLPPTFQGDRKSTRLNSSHSQISYAVFCLKKKKI